MRLFRAADITPVPAALPGCVSAFNGPLAEAARVDDVACDIMRVIGAGGIPVHEGRRDQMCTVIAGHGWMRGGEGEWFEVGVGDVALWAEGEARSWRTETGITLMSVRGRGLVGDVPTASA
ncbi:hypothetical protein [Catellatospora sp. NPDC049609]|uniref:hypothetical protein n=1 Tax=Catellatospora sp. NPDC049609 TaxID=3155505 RepID=UPI003422F4CE